MTGTSDPYVKFKIGNNEVARSEVIKKNLNPIWDEEFNIMIEDIRNGLFVQVCFIAVIAIFYFNNLQLFHSFIGI